MSSLNSCRVRRFTLIVAVIFAAAIGSMASTSAGTDSWYLLLDKTVLCVAYKTARDVTKRLNINFPEWDSPSYIIQRCQT